MEQNNLALKVSQNLKVLIKKSVYRTQDNFAEALHVDPTTLRKWLAHGIPNLEKLDQIAKLLGKKPWELLK